MSLSFTCLKLSTSFDIVFVIVAAAAMIVFLVARLIQQAIEIKKVISCIKGCNSVCF